MEDQLKQVLRRLENIEKSQNLIFKDRDILEDISIRLGKVEDQVIYLKNTIDEMKKNVKADTKEVLEEVQSTKDNIEEVKKVMGGEEN